MAKYIILDTETTGTQEEDRIIQLGYLVLGKPSEGVEVHNEFCQTVLPIKIPAMEVHGITPEMVENKPMFQALNSFKRLQELNTPDNYMVIHNAKFDLTMLEKEGFTSQMRCIDTLRCAKHLFNDSPFHRLQYFRYALDIYKEEAAEASKLGVVVKAHDAIGDVLVLKLFMSKLVAKAKEVHSGRNPMDVLVELTTTPVLMTTLKMGKHKGKLIVDVAREDSGYLNWMLKSMDNLDEDMRYSIEKALGI